MTRRITVTMVGIILLATWASSLPADETQEGQIRSLKREVEQLEGRVRELEQLLLPMKDELQARGRRARLRARFEARTEQDRKTYSQQELQEIESLYQVANRQWNTPQAQESLKKMIEKYGKANRTGCAVLYLGQMATGEQKEKYLKKAIKDFSDCWYGDGVQVGSYARYCLANYYQQAGKTAEAARLYAEIRKDYPDAIDHNGNLLADRMPK